MIDLPRSLTRDIRRRHGVVTRPELIAGGVSPAKIRRHLENGALVSLHRGMYRLGFTPDTLESRALAACLANERVVVSHLTAGRLHHLRRVGDDDIVHVMVQADRIPLTSAVVVHRTRSLLPIDVMKRADGIRLTTPLRTAFDLASMLGDLDVESIVEQLLDRRIVTPPDLHAIGRRLARSGRNGSARFARVVGGRPSWSKPADSHLEVRVWRALNRTGVTGLVRQHRVELENGSVVFIDVAQPDCRWGLEIDHVTWHGGRIDAGRDKARDRALRRLGWTIERVTDTEVERSLQVLIVELLESLRVRQSVLAA